jgi:hypothetical protein
MLRFNALKSALKIDTEKIDGIMTKLLAEDGVCKNGLLEIKKATGEKIIRIDGDINSLAVRIAEVMYCEGMKEGMRFIVNLDNINML